MRVVSLFGLAPAGLAPNQSPAAGADRQRGPHARWTHVWAATAAMWRRLTGDDCVRALAALDDDDVCHLSEAGRQLRRRARQQRSPP
jgi:hypothetical protein